MQWPGKKCNGTTIQSPALDERGLGSLWLSLRRQPRSGMVYCGRSRTPLTTGEGALRGGCWGGRHRGCFPFRSPPALGADDANGSDPVIPEVGAVRRRGSGREGDLWQGRGREGHREDRAPLLLTARTALGPEDVRRLPRHDRSKASRQSHPRVVTAAPATAIGLLRAPHHQGRPTLQIGKSGGQSRLTPPQPPSPPAPECPASRERAARGWAGARSSARVFPSQPRGLWGQRGDPPPPAADLQCRGARSKRRGHHRQAPGPAEPPWRPLLIETRISLERPWAGTPVHCSLPLF